jgi:hypothetical protein
VELEFEIIESGCTRFLKLCSALERDLESIFRVGVLKIVLQQNRPEAYMALTRERGQLTSPLPAVVHVPTSTAAFGQ